MRRPRIIIATVSLAAALAAAGGVTAAAASGPAAGGGSAAKPAVAGPATGPATVRSQTAAVTGTSERILVNGQGMPLYYYRPDSAARSLVTGALARFWPPLTSGAPTAAGVSGQVTVVRDAHGQQVAYNGHLLYTFISDRPGQVTGQGVQDFFVATPGLARVAGAPGPASTVPAAPSGGYGY